LPIDLAPHLLKALTCGWRAFRWLVLSPGLWKGDSMPNKLIIARAIVLAAAAAAAGVWLEIACGTGNIVGLAGAGICAACVGAGAAVYSTLIQVMIQDHIHD